MALSPEQEAAMNAMLDASYADESTPEPTSTPEPQAPATTEPPATEPTPEPVADPLPEGDTFPREYVEKLRREAANYRDRAKKYNDVFEGYEPEAVEEWLSLAASLKEDPQAVAERFAELADAIRSQYADPDGAAADAAVAAAADDAGIPAAAEDRPLTRKELDSIFAEREKQAALNARVVQIETDARALGYEVGSEAYDKLLWTASRLPSASIQEAHTKLQAERQAVIDSYVAEMGGRPATTAPLHGAPASGERKLSTFEEANQALEEWLRAQG